MHKITKTILNKFPFFEKPRNFFVFLINYIKNPKKIKNDLKVFLRKFKAKKIGISYHKPNFIYFDKFDKNSIVIDVGCGYEADFSNHIISKYNSKCYGVDPTKKHRKYLKNIEEMNKGKFIHLQYAVSTKKGKIIFNETQENESGSVLEDHINVLNDKIKSYEVESITLNDLPNKVNSEVIDLLKLDIEGAEYELLSQVNQSDLKVFKQIFVEFHHNAVRKYSPKDTRAIVKSLCGKGFDYFTLDDVNYLFYNLKYFKTKDIRK